MEKIHKPMGKPTRAQGNMFFQPVMQQLDEPEVAVWVFAVNGSLDYKHIHKCVCDYTIECSTIELPNFKMNFGEVAFGISWKNGGCFFTEMRKLRVCSSHNLFITLSYSVILNESKESKDCIMCRIPGTCCYSSTVNFIVEQS